MDNGESSYRRFLDGDESAFDGIMEALFHPLVFFVNRYVHDMYAAEDIAIDVFADLIVHKTRYTFKVSLKTYLFMLGRSRALNYLKHRKVAERTVLSRENCTDDRNPMPEEMVLADERKRLLYKAISDLPEEMRVAVHLVYFENMTYGEAGKVMKKTVKQVDNLLYRAKKELRTALGKEEEDIL